MSEDTEIIEIGIDSIVQEPKEKKIDIEKGFNYGNPFFIIIFLVLLGVFGIQIQNGLFELGEGIDLENFTFKYSNYREGGNIFGIFTSIFLHGSIYHLLGNLVFLYIFSLVIDGLFHLRNSIILFLGLGILAGIPGYLLNDIPSIGASGAIFGFFGVATVFYILHNKKLENNLQDIVWVLGFLALYQFFIGYITPIVDNTAHVSGYVSGFIIGYILLKNRDILQESSFLEKSTEL